MRRHPQSALRAARRSFGGLGRRPLKAAVVAIALLSAGCGLFSSEPPRPCPPVSVLKDAAELIRYRPGPGRDLIDVVDQAKVARVERKCDYDGNRLVVELKLDLAVERGPAAAAATVELPYFIAVIDARQRILAKEVFISRITFPADRRRLGVREETEQIIPLAESQSGADFEILVGFQLTEQQLEESRRRNR